MELDLSQLIKKNKQGNKKEETAEINEHKQNYWQTFKDMMHIDVLISNEEKRYVLTCND